METFNLEKLYRVDLKTTRGFEQILKNATPTSCRIYQLIKTLEWEEPATTPRTVLQRNIRSYYQVRYENRTAELFYEVFNIKPYAWLMDQFILRFSNAHIGETDIQKMTMQLTHLLKNEINVPEELVTMKISLGATLSICRGQGNRTTGVDFVDYLERLQKAAFITYGDKYQDYLENLTEATIKAKEEFSKSLFKLVENNNFAKDPTQTELTWIKDTVKAIVYRSQVPLFPMAKGAAHVDIKSVETTIKTLRLSNNLNQFQRELLTKQALDSGVTLLKKYRHIFG